MEKNSKQNHERNAGKKGSGHKHIAKDVDKVKNGMEPYQNLFLVNHFPSGRNGKVVYIRPEYHERLQRIVQLAREERTTLYSYIDNILEHHFREFGDDITKYYNDKIKPIL